MKKLLLATVTIVQLATCRSSFSQPSTEPLLTSSARVSAAAASPAQERATGALPDSAPQHQGGGALFGKGN